MEELELQKLTKLVIRLGNILEKVKLSLVTVESCTGGWLAHILTSVPTSSSWFERGFITYSDESKYSMVKVKKETLDKFGAVSKEVAVEMAEGALNNSLAQLSLSITGMAGPEGTENVPVGTCYFAWSSTEFATQQYKKFFRGDRTYINFQCVEFAILHLLQILSSKNNFIRYCLVNQKK